MRSKQGKSKEAKKQAKNQEKGEANNRAGTFLCLFFLLAGGGGGEGEGLTISRGKTHPKIHQTALKTSFFPRVASARF